MDLTLQQVLNQQGISSTNAAQIAKRTKLPRTTIASALKRPVGNSSFKIVGKILKTNHLSLDTIVDKYLAEYDQSPAQVEKDFLSQTNLDTLTIMGIKFSTKQNFWLTRDSILNSVYEGYVPTVKDVKDSYQQLEKHESTQSLVDKLIAEYQE